MSSHLEPDFVPTGLSTESTTFLPNSTIEIINAPILSHPPEHVLFDFDGTLSLVREGWHDVMVPMMVEILQGTPTTESAEELAECVREFVMELTGKQTIYQMMRLADEVRRRDGTPRDPLDYKTLYHDRLMVRIGRRREQLRTGSVPPDDMLVPGSRALLDQLADCGAKLYLASGTDLAYVREEVELLYLAEFFGPHIYGAVDDFRSFSKALVIEKIISDNNVAGDSLLGFGDGYVEIQNVKSAGGTAIAVASDESGRSGRPDSWKRTRLIAAGADIVIPDFQDHRRLIQYLWSSGK